MVCPGNLDADTSALRRIEPQSRTADFLDRCAEVFFRYAVPPNVADWPTWARRAFVLTLPVSVPLWLAWCAAFLIAFATFAVGILILGLIFYAITPFAWAFLSLRELWSD
jgi:hypothetical protein